MPVVKPKSRKPTQKEKVGKVTTDIKLAKLAIADTWIKDEDGTKYFINVTAHNGKKYVRFRADMPGERPLTFLWSPQLAIDIANAIFRAGFNAKVLTEEEIEQLWQKLRKQFKKASGKKSNPKPQANNEDEEEFEGVEFQ